MTQNTLRLQKAVKTRRGGLGAELRARRRQRRLVLKAFLTCLILVIALLMIIPFLWTLSASFKPEREVFRFPIQWIPENPTLSAYQQLLSWGESAAGANMRVQFLRAYLNSILVVIPGVLGPLITGTMAAYAFARLRFPGRDTLFLLYLVTMIVPVQVVLVPRFILANQLGIYNTLWALIIPNLTIAYGTFLLRQQFLTVPQDLIDAAKIDGAGHLQIIWHVMVPASRATIAALALLLFFWRWNDYTTPLIMINRVENLTIPIAIARLIEDPVNARWSVVMASTVLGTAPLIIIFLSANRFFVRSLVHTGIRG